MYKKHNRKRLTAFNEIKFKSKWARFTKFKKTKNNCDFFGAKKAIQKATKIKKGLDRQSILNFMKCRPSFIGCYAENELKSLKLQMFPSFLIANLDTNQMKGSHWIGIGIFKSRIEIFDPLGFEIFKWPRIPCDLLNFLHRLTVSRDVNLCHRIQDDKSVLCGFYSMFYVYAREYFNFTEIISLFSSVSSRNDRRLIHLFSYLSHYILLFR